MVLMEKVLLKFSSIVMVTLALGFTFNSTVIDYIKGKNIL